MFVNRGGEIETMPFDPDSIPVAEPSGEYIIGYGDVIDVLFLYNKEYSRENIKVRPDGKISYPYIGEVSVAGNTVVSLDSLLTEKFSEIVRNPDITVILREFEPQSIYVLGEVNAPGAYRYQKSQTLVSALAMGGGMKKSARRNNVVVVRRVAYDHVVGIEVDVEKLFEGNRYDLDMPLRPFDIIMVPKSRLTSTEEFISSMYNVLVKPMDLYLKGWNVINVKTVYDFYKSTGQAR